LACGAPRALPRSGSGRRIGYFSSDRPLGDYGRSQANHMCAARMFLDAKPSAVDSITERTYRQGRKRLGWNDFMTSYEEASSPCKREAVRAAKLAGSPRAPVRHHSCCANRRAGDPSCSQWSDTACPNVRNQARVRSR